VDEATFHVASKQTKHFNFMSFCGVAPQTSVLQKAQPNIIWRIERTFAERKSVLEPNVPLPCPLLKKNRLPQSLSA
jgi:hypothetical protein